MRDFHLNRVYELVRPHVRPIRRAHESRRQWPPAKRPRNGVEGIAGAVRPGCLYRERGGANRVRPAVLWRDPPTSPPLCV